VRDNKEKYFCLLHANFYSIVIPKRKFIALKQKRQKRSTVTHLFCSKKINTCKGNLDTV